MNTCVCCFLNIYTSTLKQSYNSGGLVESIGHNSNGAAVFEKWD